MLRAIQLFFENRIRSGAEAGNAVDREHALRLATAALLIEMVRADFQVRPEERQAVLDVVQSAFGLTQEETRELIALAELEADEAVSLYQFTSLIDKHFPPERKVQVVELLWRVAYSDGMKDMHEEHLVRKIADLLHVPHREFLRMRHKVEAELGR